MPSIVDRFLGLGPAQRLLEAASQGQQRSAGGLWGGSGAVLIAGLAERLVEPVLVVTADDDDAARLLGELATFAANDDPTGSANPGTGSTWTMFPEQAFDIDGVEEATTRSQRIRTLQAGGSARRPRVIAGLRALLQPVPRPKALARGRRTLVRGEAVRQDDLLQAALSAGLRRVPVVLAPGEVSLRGDVLDVFGLGAPHALRLEFFDDVLESLRTFDPATQESLEVLEQTELVLGHGEESSGHAIEHFARPDLVVVHYEPLRLEERQQSIVLHESALAQAHRLLRDSLQKNARVDVSSLPSHDLDFKVLSAGSAVGSGEADPLGRLRSLRGLRGSVHIICRTAPERDRLQEIFSHKKVSLKKEKITLQIGALDRGFRIPDLDLTVISNVEFAGVPAPVRIARERQVVPSKALASFFELGPRDLVVHSVHGIAMFEGIERVERATSAEDHLRLCFQDDVRLLVPASKIHLVQKYVGAGDAKPKLDKLGGKGFARRKEEVQRALFDMAADLLEVQARRETLTRESYPRDPLEGEMLDAFPFTDTDDQAVAWSDIRKDLESNHPMDRLLCGDVGFGKTEVAMRAAFKVAITGRQVAVLVPTTVLAEQHGRTFAGRFEPHGLTVEVLSRFRGPKDRKRILAGTASGAVDVLIGTHRILSDDVAFQNLGMMVIDEEQRFGVRHKEQLKTMRLAVDVLTLSATPIPRTLHSSLLGLRSISTLAIPPDGRQEVETHVLFRDVAVLRNALTRELAREGQVFVLHNRVSGLESVARDIHEMAPEARIAIGHGQMTANDMERTIRQFVQGEFDVLVCTTIIENGLDLPRANTIIIDRAEHFGLAELHQLRGRVGRSSRQAYCFLVLDRAHPPGQDALKRLKALEEFSHLGAGFAISMRDLEIRGAGNLLGPQQSGHIGAVGYEMYTQLLRTAVASAKAGRESASRNTIEHHIQEVDVDMQVQAYLPDSFLQEPKARLECLREMDGATDPDAAERIRKSLRDRFGKLPAPVETLLQVFLLKHLLLHQGVLGVQFTGEDRIIVRHVPGHPLGGAWLDAFAEVRAVEAGKTHLMLPRRLRGQKVDWTGERVLRHSLGALLGTSDLR